MWLCLFPITVHSSDLLKKDLPAHLAGTNTKKGSVPPPPPAPTIIKNDSDELRAEDLKNYQSYHVIYDEGFHPVEISLRDISRIVCSGDIEKVVYSKEKGIEVKTTGKNAFLKNLPKEVFDPLTGKLNMEYDNRPKELYLVCEGRTFSLLLIPKNTPPTTTFLKLSHSDKKIAYEHEKSSTYENTMLNLIKDAYFDRVPTGYSSKDVNKIFDFKEMSIIHKTTYEGMMYEINVFTLIAKTEVNLDEKVVLSALKIKNPVACSFVETTLRASEQTRLIVVRRLGDE